FGLVGVRLRRRVLLLHLSRLLDLALDLLELRVIGRLDLGHLSWRRWTVGDALYDPRDMAVAVTVLQALQQAHALGLADRGRQTGVGEQHGVTRFGLVVPALLAGSGLFRLSARASGVRGLVAVS